MTPVGARRRVWDVPTRLFHWILVALIGFSWWSAETFHMDWHRYSGLTVLGLLLFRILWGLFGTSTARFAGFVRGPRGVIRYLRPGEPSGRAPIGHNPLGGWSVVAMLLLLLVQVTSGLFAVDTDGIESGPLSYLVDFDQGRTASSIHGTSFTVLQVLIVLHVAAILFYLLFRRRNLLWTMIVGSEPAIDGGDHAVRVPLWRLAAAIVAAGGAAYWIGNGLTL